MLNGVKHLVTAQQRLYFFDQILWSPSQNRVVFRACWPCWVEAKHLIVSLTIVACQRPDSSRPLSASG